LFVGITTTTITTTTTTPHIILHAGLKQFISKIRRQKKEGGGLFPAPKEVTQQQILDLFHVWNDGLRSGQSSIVAKIYANDAILIPTSLNEPRVGSTSIQEYFENVVKRSPSVTIIDGTITMGYNWAMNIGIYEWVFGDDRSKKQARFTFVYVYNEDSEEWKITHHHSSAFPKG